MALIKTVEKTRLTVKIQTLAAVSAVVGAVALPQFFHMLGRITGLGTALGETFLPMHLPILLVGLLAGPYAGAVAGLLGPLLSFMLTGMPTISMLPFIIIELCAYGFSSGAVRKMKMPTIGKVLISQAFGRILRAAAILLAVYVFGKSNVGVSVIWMSISKGLFGLCLQWLLLPLLVYRIEGLKRNEN